MKKTFKTFALMLLAAFAFSSCVDVPAPYNLPDKSSNSGSGGGSSVVEGTPVTCAQAKALAEDLADGATSTETYTITGYITQIVGEVSRNQQTFWMDDTKGSGKVFEAYWANLPDGVTAFTVGMKVKITGKLMKYVNPNNGNVIPEMKNATVQILEDDGSGTTIDEDAIPISCALAAQMTRDLPDNTSSTETYVLTGYIRKIIGAVKTNQQSFWMSDHMEDDVEIFQAYYANLPDGVSEFTVGMKVKIIGKLFHYAKDGGGGAPEMKNPTVIILENGDGGETPPAGDVEHITIAEFLEKADANTTYELTGTVKNIANTTYGNFDLVEDNASIYIYGLLDLSGAAQKFASLGIVEGDVITLTGKYVLFNGKPEIKNAQFVRKESGGGGDSGETPPVGDVQHITIAEFLEKADVNTTYELTGTVQNIANTTYGNFDLVEDNASIYIYGLLDLSGAAQKFATLGIAEGDIITLTGKYVLFNDKPEIKNAQFIRKESGGGGQGGDGGDGGDTPGPGGETLTELINGGFEEWASDTEATGWMASGSAAPGNAILSKSSDAHTGSYACLVSAPGTTNKRLATQTITLEAGSYTFSYYAKTTTSTVTQTRPGYVPINDNGSVGNYYYAKNGTENAFFNLNNNDWTLVTYDFELTAKTKLSLLVMNSTLSHAADPRNSH